MTQIQLFYSKTDLKDWQDKSLLTLWKKEYPELIQNHVFDIWNNRNNLNLYGFGELYTGIYFAKQGYKFLYEPWLENFLLMPSIKLENLRSEFNEIFISHAGKEVFEYITKEITKKINKGQPDIFVYNDNEWFFAEVKKEKDILTREQKIFIEEIYNFNQLIEIKLVSLRLIEN